MLSELNYNSSTSSTLCTLKYSSMNKLLTKTKFPYFELSDCKHNKCKIGEYQCAEDNYCIPLKNVCDNISHCWTEDDEENCGIFIS